MGADLRARLLSEGWEERFSASGGRLEEVAEYYRSLGYEVRIEAPADVAAEGSCTSCFTVTDAGGPAGVLFTRLVAAPIPDDEELFGESEPGTAEEGMHRCSQQPPTA